MSDSVLDRWLDALDQLSYYALFGVSPEASPDEVKRAFHGFAAQFHPDGHAGESATTRQKIAAIFRRGTEAYRVLSSPHLRAIYDEALARGEIRPTRLLSAVPPPPGRDSVAPKTSVIDQLRNPKARAFVAQAMALESKGDLAQAKLQLAVALNLEGASPALEELLASVTQRAAAARK